MTKSKRYSAATATPSPRRLRSLYFKNWRAKWLFQAAQMLFEPHKTPQWQTIYFVDARTQSQAGWYDKTHNSMFVNDLSQFIADPALQRDFLAERMKNFDVR